MILYDMPFVNDYFDICVKKLPQSVFSTAIGPTKVAFCILGSTYSYISTGVVRGERRTSNEASSAIVITVAPRLVYFFFIPIYAR